MTGKPVVALAFVQQDVQRAYDYCARGGRLPAERFLQRYFATTDQIARNPNLFPLKSEDYHRALIPPSRFAVYYFEEPLRSVVIAVVDASRRPDFIQRLVQRRRQHR